MDKETVHSLNRDYGYLVDFEVIHELITLYALRALAAVLIVFVGYLAIKLGLKILKKMFQAAHVDPTLQAFLLSCANIVGQIVMYMAALSAAGIETTSIVAMMGAAGLAVGLALQGMLSSFASGVLIIFFRYFKKGDYVELAGVKGRIHEIQIFNTHIISDDGKKMILPNSKITGDKIVIHNTE